MPSNAVMMMDTQQWILHGQATDRDYLIQVSIPDTPPPAGGYPVLYVLDGNARFALVVTARDTLTLESSQGGLGPWVVVGIGYPGIRNFDSVARSEDYTLPISGLPEQDEWGRPQGGADRFLHVIRDQIQPQIAERLAIDPARQALLGHSYGGLFALYTALTAPEAFSHYLAISPSLWWGQEYLYDVLADSAVGGSALRVMIGVGARETEHSPASSSAGDDEAQSRLSMRGSAAEFASRLRQRYPCWDIDAHEFEDVGHAAVMWPAMQATWLFLERPFRDKKAQ